MPQFLSRQDALRGAIASSEIEGLVMNEEDRLIAERWAAGEISGDEAVALFISALRTRTACDQSSEESE